MAVLVAAATVMSTVIMQPQELPVLVLAAVAVAT